MKYVLFVLALVMIAVGCHAIYIGSQVIEVERGWSSVIAGSTIAVGGALLFGVAWLVRTVEQLRAAVLQASAVEATGSPGLKFGRKAQTERARVDRKGLPEDMPAPASPIAWPPHTTPAIPVQEEELLAEADFDVEPLGEVQDEPEYASFAAEADTILSMPFTEETARPARSKPSAKVGDFWRRVGKDSGKSSLAERAFLKTSEPPVERALGQTTSPLRQGDDERPFEPGPETTSDAQDWLERKFPSREPNEEREPQVEVGDELGEELEAFTETADRETPPPLVGEPQEFEAASVTEEAAVIGRYEAEGTCYTMFADGSIEAQSERGVFRFKSMEELKAYFETLREPQ